MALILVLKVIIDIWNLTCPGILNSDLSYWKKVQQVYMQLQEYLDIFLLFTGSRKLLENVQMHKCEKP